MVLSGQQRTCVACGQSLPGSSKLTRQVVPKSEADQLQWPSQENGDGTVTVDMCLQCQITRSNQRKHPSLS